MVGFFGEQMGVGRNTPTRWFDTPNLPIDKLMKAAKLLKREPGDLFPRLKKVVPVTQSLPHSIAEDAPRPGYGNGADALQKCTEERAQWQNKAFEWIEKYNHLLEAHNLLLQAQMEKQKPHRPVVSEIGEACYPLVSQKHITT